MHIVIGQWLKSSDGDRTRHQHRTNKYIQHTDPQQCHLNMPLDAEQEEQEETGDVLTTAAPWEKELTDKYI